MLVATDWDIRVMLRINNNSFKFSTINVLISREFYRFCVDDEILCDVGFVILLVDLYIVAIMVSFTKLSEQNKIANFFLLGFVFPLMWYYTTILYLGNYYREDPRERAGLAATAIAVSSLPNIFDAFFFVNSRIQKLNKNGP
ncbi:hypothetical protein CDL12_12736 [Handroanthus impetiginosus]|uniref:Uncharacterized protein n=1 Tax=Handroanthus impetiginosus TaxID=429701 RepID=A0A2G9HAT4_9LAMI|nr:hypothetical protein CDL12_12736 [Handroanthus impetiginosus]